MRILAKTLALLTFKDRYFPKIEWSDKSWTHNAFRAFEYIFGRRVGIRAEISSGIEVNKDGSRRVWHVAHSWEGAFALAETYIRETLASLKPRPFKIFIPILQTPQGMQMFASPYLFAIAYDTSANSGAQSASTPWSFSHTVTGSDPTITMNARWWTNSGSQSVSANTYAGVALTLIINRNSGDSNYNIRSLYLPSPSTGANTSSISFSAGSYGIMGTSSFSGTNTASVLGASNQFAIGSGTSINNSLTTNFNNSFVLDCIGSTGGDLTSLANSQSTNYAVGASPACSGSSRIQKVTAGSQAMAWSWTGADLTGQIIYEIKELVASGPASVKTWDGVTQSTGVKTYLGVALASVKSVLGVT